MDLLLACQAESEQDLPYCLCKDLSYMQFSMVRNGHEEALNSQAA